MKIIYDIQDGLYINRNLLNSVATMCEIVEETEEKLYIHLQICDDEKIQNLNKEHRNKANATDVLSFPSLNYRQGTLKHNRKLLHEVYDVQEKAYFIGDSIISLDHAIKQAKMYGHSLQRELAFLLTHSILHLFGYDHLTDKEENEMIEMQNKILNALNITRDEKGQISDDTLAKLAIKAMDFSYSPYSKFPVGACLLSKDGEIFLGCNIENAAFGSTMCAERTAVFKAVSEGVTEFEAIAIAGKNIKPYPCGSCRQVLNEFAPDIRVIITDQHANYDVAMLYDILPHGFGPKDIKRGKNE